MISVQKFEPRLPRFTPASAEIGFSYHAISYTWGEETRSHHIWIGSERFPVTKNCYYALWQARKANAYKNIPLWIDSICINQHNNEEKSSQVSIMADIYACASRTYISVGPHRDDSEFLLSFLNHKAFSIPDAPVSVGDNGDYERLYQAASAFCQRPYWNRAWIIQELAFSKTLLCMVGEDIMHLWRLEEVINDPGRFCIPRNDRFLRPVESLLRHRKILRTKNT